MTNWGKFSQSFKANIYLFTAWFKENKSFGMETFRGLDFHIIYPFKRGLMKIHHTVPV